MKPKKMRVFPRDMMDYEKVYTSPKYLARFNIERLQKPDGFKDINEYRNSLRYFLLRKSIQLWDDIVQTEWMLSKFKYLCHDKKRVSKYANAHVALNIFTKENVGMGFSYLTSTFYFLKIKSFFKEIFPDFSKGDPFKNPEKYAYPFGNISIDYLLLVYQMPERMDLLKHASKKNMTFGVFIDFVINYIGKCNDMDGDETFVFVRLTHYPLYIKYNKKK